MPEDLACCNVNIHHAVDALVRIRELTDVMIGSGPGAVKAYYRKGGDGFPTGLPTSFMHLREHAREIRQQINAVLGDRE